MPLVSLRPLGVGLNSSCRDSHKTSVTGSGCHGGSSTGSGCLVEWLRLLQVSPSI